MLQFLCTLSHKTARSTGNYRPFVSNNSKIRMSSLKNRQITIAESGKELRKLVAFDFDHTVVNDNTDIVVRDLLDRKFITPALQQLHKDGKWTAYMQEIFDILHTNGFTKAQIKSTIENMNEVPGLKQLIRELHATNTVDVIIVSDSNSTFIKYWCDFNNITECIKAIFTNPAEFDSQGALQIQPFHHQEHCSLSSENICKGDVVEQFVKQQADERNVIYETIFYVGDGLNDYCPILRLGRMDYGLARESFALQKKLRSELDGGESKNQIDAIIKYWSNGNEIKEAIFNDKK